MINKNKFILKKLGAVSTQLNSCCVKRCSGFIFGGRIVAERNSTTFTNLTCSDDFIRLHSRHVYHQVSTQKASITSSTQVGDAIRKQPASGVFMLECWFNLDYAAQ